MRGPAIRVVFLAALLASVAFAAPAIAARDGGSFEAAAAAYLKRDFAASLRMVRNLAAKGDARGQYYLGRHYQFGEGVAKDYAEAYFWYRRAEASGHVEAKFFRSMLENYWNISAADKARAERKLAALKPTAPTKDGPPVAAVADRPPVEGIKSRPSFRNIETTTVAKNLGTTRIAEAPPTSDTKVSAAARTNEASRSDAKWRVAATRTDDRPPASTGSPPRIANWPERPTSETSSKTSAPYEPRTNDGNPNSPVEAAYNSSRYAAAPTAPAYVAPPPPSTDYPPHFYRSYVPRYVFAPPPTYDTYTAPPN